MIVSETALIPRTGRWRTQWVVDQAAGLVRGTIQVDVHYYEQGNVSHGDVV